MRFQTKTESTVVWTVLFWRSPGLPYRTLRVLELLTKLHPLLLIKRSRIAGFSTGF